MIHSSRPHSVVSIDDVDELARLLVDHTWCGCAGFQHAGLLFLNDSFSPDGAQEYAVFNGGPAESGTWTGKQIESITFSWCSQDEALTIIRNLAGGETCGWFGNEEYRLEIDIASDHRCALCA